LREELEKMLPEVGLIEDRELAGKVIAVWEKALKRAGMEPSELEKMPFTLLIEDVGVDFVQHVRAVTRMSYEMSRVMKETYGDLIGINTDYLVAGALLHDVGKIVEVEREGKGWKKSEHGRYLRHPFSGVGLAYEEGLPDEVVHLIAVHSREGEGARISPEAVIIHYADFTNFEPFKLVAERGGDGS